MNRNIATALACFILTACATHTEIKAPQTDSRLPDSPHVTVTSAVDVLTTVGLNQWGTIDIRPEPTLPVAFERAIEKYVDAGAFRIISAQLEVRTMLAKQTVILDMQVQVDGRIYRARNVNETNSAGWGNKYIAAIPSYIDAAAKQIADQL